MDLKNALSRALIEMIVFLEFSNKEIIDEDTAVKKMEQIASILIEMDEKDKTEFLQICNKVANEYTDGNISEFISNMGKHFGLIDE